MVGRYRSFVEEKNCAISENCMVSLLLRVISCDFGGSRSGRVVCQGAIQNDLITREFPIN